MFLITILYCVRQPVHFRRRSADSALPKLENSPAQVKESRPILEVSAYVLVEFRLPEFGAGLGRSGVSAPGMPMPETAVNENAKVIAW